MKGLNKQMVGSVVLFVVLGLAAFFLLENNILNNFIDNALEIPVNERHD